MSTVNYMCIEDIDELSIKMRKWEAEQPDYIAVEMTNAEIVKAHCYYENVFNQLVAGAAMLSDTKLIDGKLYKKVKNPKSYFDPRLVIPW